MPDILYSKLECYLKTKPMIRKKLGIFLFAGLLSLTVSCNKDAESPTLGKGSFALSLSTNEEVVPVLRSETQTQSVETPSVEDFRLSMSNENGTFSRQWSSINNLKECWTGCLLPSDNGADLSACGVQPPR